MRIEMAQAVARTGGGCAGRGPDQRSRGGRVDNRTGRRDGGAGLGWSWPACSQRVCWLGRGQGCPGAVFSVCAPEEARRTLAACFNAVSDNWMAVLGCAAVFSISTCLGYRAGEADNHGGFNEADERFRCRIFQKVHVIISRRV